MSADRSDKTQVQLHKNSHHTSQSRQSGEGDTTRPEIHLTWRRGARKKKWNSENAQDPYRIKNSEAATNPFERIDAINIRTIETGIKNQGQIGPRRRKTLRHGGYEKRYDRGTETVASV